MVHLIDFAASHDGVTPSQPRCVWGTPRYVLTAYDVGQVCPIIMQAEAAARAGAWVVGYVCYEAAPAFDAALQVCPPLQTSNAVPLVWFAVHDAPLTSGDSASASASESAPHIVWDTAPLNALDTFADALAHIQSGIAQGTYYQVNYTTALWGRLQAGTASTLFAALQRAQPGGYAALLDIAVDAAVDAASAHQVLSLSPELFFDWRADANGQGPILTRPMKGTAARGRTPAQDAHQAALLGRSAKERAENVMIVDLLRNDLSRIATAHSVRVERLFHVQALPTVWQMTSDVQAHTRPGTRLVDVFRALFPCGSVTGAPKVQAMRAIAALEGQPRGVYCGALGWLRPDGQGGMAATFNVPIRTLELRGTRVRYNVGSGIVWGADTQAEWREWHAKRAFVERASAPFELLETLALDEGTLRQCALHLARMQGAAAHFGYPWDEACITACLQSLIAQHPHGLWRVRLLLNAHGQPQAQAFALTATPQPVRLKLAPRPLSNAHSEFVHYKTTRRAHYAAFAPDAASGVFDTLLYNEAGEITETTFGNVAALLDGRWVTPALSSGLLPGVGRALALQHGRVIEQVLRLREDVPRVQAWAFINSLRGWLSAELVQDEAIAS